MDSIHILRQHLDKWFCGYVQGQAKTNSFNFKTNKFNCEFLVFINIFK